ncbi:MAG: hypothetical protein K8F91_13090 [Candidatus Obscuribacterales bacterium]|nr:hypothetical protein [Candidatus Obscuribacterales bacterium]
MDISINEKKETRLSVLDDCVDIKIVSAASSLESFAIVLEGEKGLLFEAGTEASQAIVLVKVVDNSSLPALSEAVCTVDWSWIEGSAIQAYAEAGPGVSMALDRVGPLTVSAAFHEGKPFLSFQPFKPAKK